MNIPHGTTPTTVDQDVLTDWTRANARARAAYARVMADQEIPEPDPRYCPCGADLAHGRQRCDPCRDEARRANNRKKSAAHRARKAAQ